MERKHDRRYSTAEAAEYVGYPKSVVLAAYKNGDIPAERPSGFERGPLFFRESDLDAWLDSIAINS